MHPDDYTVLPIPPLPQTQCLEKSAFRQPPLDGSLTIPEMYDWHLAHSSGHPLFAYADESDEEHVIYWPDGARAVHRAGRLVQSLAERNSTRASTRQLFVILSATDTITYFTLIEGILRAGHIVFPISPRNSAPAVAHLLSKTHADYVFVGPEKSMQDLAAAAFSIMDDTGSAVPVKVDIPTFQELYPKDSGKDFEPLPAYKPDWKDPALYVHSSGSTAFPKPILWSHYRYFLMSITPYLGERNLTGKRLACHSMPMYHGMGVMQTGWTATAGLVLTAFKPQSPAIAPTPELVIQGSIATKSNIIFCVPSFVEAWAKNPEHVNMLRQVDGILYGGGPLSQSVGDELSDQGISIFVLYASSECAVMSPILPKEASKRDWNYFKFPDGLEPRFAWDETGNAEVIFLPGKFLIPCVFNTVVDGVDAYATNDLLSPHPTKPGYWKIYGRADDQIMHNTGEKTNPAPLENMLNQDPHVRAAVMFGRGKFNAGVLIDPRPAYAFDPSDEEKLVEFRNKIWPTVEKLNEYAPQHSRIFKEMIIVAKPSKPFQYTAKNTARRQAIINDYESEIEVLYTAIAETTQADLPPPPTWTSSSALPFVRQVVNRVLKHSLQDEDDLFQNGCDSLQATWIRNSLLHALRDTTDVNTRAVPTSFVYQNPTIKDLATFVVQLVNSQQVEGNNERRVEKMLNMVGRYLASFRSHSPSADVVEMPSKDTVLVTGTTGSLGAGLLAQLVASPDVERVYALNRGSELPILDRQKRALRSKGLDESIAENEKAVLVEVSMGAPAMGIPSDILEQIRSSTTHIIHNAWPVNFNMSLESFEPNVKGVRDLIDIALTSTLPRPPHILYISSVGVLRQIDHSVPAAETPIDAEVAVGMGYSESKWVGEKLLQEASKATNIRTTSLRLGQVCGDMSLGSWNEIEWFPRLVRSSVHLKAFPSLDKVISWIPVDAAAKAIVEMRTSPDSVLHLAHPRPISWATIEEVFTGELKLPSATYEVWMKLLEDVAAGMDSSMEAQLLDRYPALNIIDFFSQAKMSKSPEAMGVPPLDVTKAQRVAVSLSSLPQLTQKDACNWIAAWKATGFI